MAFLRIAHLEPGDSPLYDPETGLYTTYGFGPPVIYNYFWRAKEDEKGVHLDYIRSEERLRYTVKDGRVISAIDVTREAEGMTYGAIGR